MFFEYPKLLWLLVVPALLVLRYLYVELKDRRPHLRVSSVTPWKKGGKTVLGVIRHIPFVLRVAALSLIVVAIARPRSSTKVEKVDTEGIDIVLAMDVSTSMLARDFTPDRISAAKDIGGTTSHYTHGVLLNFHEDSLDIVATDGHRLAMEKMDNPSPEVKDRSLLIPTTIVGELSRALTTEEDKPVEIYYLSNQVFFRFGNSTFGGSLFDIRYPDYNKVVPKDSKSIANVNRVALREALQRVLIVFKVKEQNPVVRLETQGDSLIISSESQEVGKGVEEMPFTKGAPFADMRIALNPGYLVDVLSAVDADTVDLNWTSEVNPLKVEVPDKPGFVYIVMPIRMD